MQYAASPVRRMETASARRRRPPQPAPGDAAPAQATPGAVPSRADVVPIAEAASKDPAADAGPSATQKGTIKAGLVVTAAPRKEDGRYGEGQADHRVRKPGKPQGMHRAESCSPRSPLAGKTKHAGIRHRVTEDDEVSSGSVLSSSSSLDLYQMLKARSRRKQEKQLRHGSVASSASASSCSACAEVSLQHGYLSHKFCCLYNCMPNGCSYGIICPVTSTR